MKLSLETRLFRFELQLELGFPGLVPKKYEVVPRKRCHRVQDRLVAHISSHLKNKLPHDFRAE